jgi:ABC-type transporter Mla MlaB component
MNNKIQLEKEIIIRNVATIWKKIKEQISPLEINMESVEKIDGAGLQLIVFLKTLEKDFPDQFKLINISGEIDNKLINSGFEV